MSEQKLARPAPPALDRRVVLGAALAGGAGVAAARLLGLRRTVEVEPSQLNADAVAKRSGLDWVSPLDDEAARVAHLLRRTSFGYTAAELEAAVADGYERTVDRLIETPPAEPPSLSGADEASQMKPLRPDQLQAWWLDWMLKTPTPFAEKMTLLWHGHFTSEFRKVGLQSPYMYWQNRTWRSFALSDLRSMLHQVTVDPAMLTYLDLARSSGRNPNENYARELMELYTMGSGTFTEDDVKAASKALAGWREPRTETMVKALVEGSIRRTGSPPRNTPEADTVKTGIFEQRRAYNGPELTFLGTRKRWDTEAVIDRILEQDSVAPFIARKMLTRFVDTNIDEATVARIAERLRQSRYDVRTLMRDVLTSPEMTAPAAYRALVRSPIEVMVSTAKALDAPRLSRLIAGAGQGMGQVLFDPPSVGGWPENAAWISSNTMLARINFVTSAVAQLRRIPPAGDAHARFLDSTLSAQTIQLLNAVADDRGRWTVVLASPEFQLK